jgi:hypothetical protein
LLHHARVTVARSAPEQSGPPEPSRGTVVGRYVLLDELGAGNMGVVYAAYDPELDRKVALKVVLPARSGQGAMRARMLREAHALAKLSHPNVVAIHDVGTHDDQVWIAMEFVAGQTLSAWARQPRPWAESLRVLVDAARGVAAAHAAGLVHRDLKPDNVMIDVEGRVRVMDFGLAHGRASAAAEDTEAPSVDEPMPSVGTSSLAEQLTRAGAAPGTPAYMAPEQWRGGEAGAAADQFGWSVMAWELLYGERPFQATTAAGLAVAVTSGRRQPPPRGRRVPGWLRRVIERGLAIEPSERWPSMTALLAEVERGRARARMNVLAAAAVGVVALVALVALLRDWEVARREAACVAEGAAFDAVWHDDARRTLREAFAATGLAEAAATADRIMPWLDERAAAWRRSRTQACLDFEVRGTRDAALKDAASWCLEDRQMQFAALTAEFARPTAATVRKAVTAATSLGDPEVCLDELVLRRLPVPPSDAREALRAARLELMLASSRDLTGDYAGGREAAARVSAATGAWPPLRAAARAQESVSLARMGK